MDQMQEDQLKSIYYSKRMEELKGKYSGVINFENVQVHQQMEQGPCENDILMDFHSKKLMKYA